MFASRILTRSTAQVLQNEPRDRKLAWTVFHDPAAEASVITIRPCIADETFRELPCHIEAATLVEARAMLPRGLHNIGRDKRTDPGIFEVWI